MTKRFVILCLATGDYVKLDDLAIFRYCDDFVTASANIQEITNNRRVNSWQPTILSFDKYEAAHWFMRRRLSFNARRTASAKLMVMDMVFKLNGINPLSNKVEYDIIERENE